MAKENVAPEAFGRTGSGAGPSKPLEAMATAFEPVSIAPPSARASASAVRAERLPMNRATGVGGDEDQSTATDTAPFPKLEMSLVRFHANNPSWQPTSREQQTLLESADLCVSNALATVGAHAPFIPFPGHSHYSPSHLQSLYRSRLVASSLVHHQQQQQASLFGNLSAFGGGGLQSSATPAAPAPLFASQLVGNEYLSQHMIQSRVSTNANPNPQVYMVCFMQNIAVQYSTAHRLVISQVIPVLDSFKVLCNVNSI